MNDTGTTLGPSAVVDGPAFDASVRKALFYDPATGLFTWLISSPSAIRGKPAGSIDFDGYVCIGFQRRRFKAHRLAWLFFYGFWPTSQIDHINGIKTDNRIANLRLASARVNSQNLRKATRPNKLGVLGVSIVASTGRFAAQIKETGRSRHIGTYGTPEQAHAAYVAAKRRLHEGCTL